MPEIDFETWMPVLPACARCGDSRSKPTDWRTRMDDGTWSCCSCLTDEEGKWYKPKLEKLKNADHAQER
jgi:hypothetical protein